MSLPPIARPLTLAWDRSVSRLGVARDGKRLLATADDTGQHALFSIDPASGKVQRLVGDGYVDDFAPTQDGIVYSRASLAAPADLILTGGHVVTLDEAVPAAPATAVAVREGRVLAVGSDARTSASVFDESSVCPPCVTANRRATRLTVVPK